MAELTGHSLLLIDDEPAQVRLVAAIAARAGWRVTSASRLEDAEAMLGRRGTALPDAILLDRWEPGPGAGEAVRRLRARAARTPILIMTAQSSVANAVEAMRAGASDYLAKPIAPDRLLAALEAAVDTHSPAGELRPMVEKMGEALSFDGVIGATPAFRAALAVAARAARASVPVLIEGESGVGKEVVALAIHAASPRAARPMVTVNCGAIPANLVESELFGHERGAFTGAFDKRIGRFEEAHGSTLFLDEVGELPLDAQVKLLRALQSGEITPIGGRASREVDVRIVAATNRRLVDEIAAGRFREDLYYRLNVVQVTIPPLRERIEDLPQLARHLLGRIAQAPGMRPLDIAEDALALLATYRWPGNVRQLQNTLFRAALLCDGDVLQRSDFPQIAQVLSLAERSERAALRQSSGDIELFGSGGHIRTLEQIEGDIIRLAIRHYRGRMTEVARRLGIGRSTLYRKLGELGIEHAA